VSLDYTTPLTAVLRRSRASCSRAWRDLLEVPDHRAHAASTSLVAVERDPRLPRVAGVALIPGIATSAPVIGWAPAKLTGARRRRDGDQVTRSARPQRTRGASGVDQARAVR
jgi:hypothetical protein